MGKFDIDKLTMNEEKYSVRLSTQITNQNGFKEQTHGSRKKLYVYNRLIASTSPSSSLDLGGLEKKQFSSFLGHFNKKLYAQFISNPELLTKEVKFYGTARHRNTKVWNTIPIGAFFYNIDMSSAYWQVLYRLGYIDQSMYEKYIDEPKYKTAKRFCVSFLARPNKMVYHKLDGTNYVINCNTEVLNKVYQNVRKELYRLVQVALNGKETYIEYNIDGVLVPISMVPEIKEFFKKEGLKYKTTICQKINETQYKAGTKEKNFRRQVNKAIN